MQLQCPDPRLKFPSVALAAEALLSFAEQHQADPQRTPSFAQLRQAGRHDLITSYRKFGQARVLEAAGMKPNPGGRDSKHRLVCSPPSPLLTVCILAIFPCPFPPFVLSCPP